MRGEEGNRKEGGVDKGQLRAQASRDGRRRGSELVTHVEVLGSRVVSAVHDGSDGKTYTTDHNTEVSSSVGWDV